MRLHLDSHAAVSGANQSGAASATQGASAGAKSGRESGAGASDSVGLSGPSAILSQFAADRSARIHQLSAAVRAGSYSVSSAAIGSALVRQAISH